MTRTAHTRRSVMVVVAAAVAVAACGTTTQYHASPRIVVKDPTALIASSANSTAAATSARMTGEMTLSSDALPRDVTFGLDGVSSVDGRRGDLKMDMSSLLGVVPGARPGSSLVVEVRLVDGVEYMDFGTMFRALANGRPIPPSLATIKWLKLDFSKLTGGTGALGSSPASFTQYLEYLQGVGEVTTVGDDVVRGTPSTHYRAVVDRAKLRAELRARGDSALGRLAEQGLDLFDGAMTFDVWIGDGDRLVHRIAFSLGMTVEGQAAHIAMTIDLYDFGVPVDVQPPPADQVRDFGALTSLAGSGV